MNDGRIHMATFGDDFSETNSCHTAVLIYLFTTFVKRIIHKLTCSNALFINEMTLV